MSNLFDAGVPIAFLLFLLVLPAVVEVRRRRVVRRHFQHEVMYRGSWFPFLLPFVVGVAKNATIYAGTCRTCGTVAPPGGVPLVALARHARQHERKGERAPA